MRSVASRLRQAMGVALLFGFVVGFAHADLISTEQLTADAKIRADREKVRTFLGRSDAERALQGMGVAPEAAKQRVDALTDAEVETIAAKIDALPAGGFNFGDSRLILIIVAIVAIVLII